MYRMLQTLRAHANRYSAHSSNAMQCVTLLPAQHTHDIYCSSAMGQSLLHPCLAAANQPGVVVLPALVYDLKEALVLTCQQNKHAGSTTDSAFIAGNALLHFVRNACGYLPVSCHLTVSVHQCCFCASMQLWFWQTNLWQRMLGIDVRILTCPSRRDMQFPHYTSITCASHCS